MVVAGWKTMSSPGYRCTEPSSVMSRGNLCSPLKTDTQTNPLPFKSNLHLSYWIKCYIIFTVVFTKICRHIIYFKVLIRQNKYSSYNNSPVVEPVRGSKTVPQVIKKHDYWYKITLVIKQSNLSNTLINNHQYPQTDYNMHLKHENANLHQFE